MKKEDNGNVRPRKIAGAIEEFIENAEWDETVDIDEDTGDSTLYTKYEIRNQIYDLYFEGEEKTELLALYLYAPYRVIEGKSVDAALLVNYINDRYRYRGRLTVTDSGQIRYKEVIDTENIEASPAMLENMLMSAGGLFERHTEQLGAVALTRKTYEAIREEYDRKDEQEKARREDGDENGV
jgi:hypothetical protein